MITELTPEQKGQAVLYAEKWRNIGLSTEPANRAEAEKGIQLAYQMAGYQPPKDILWFDSPYAMCQYRRDMTDAHLCIPIIYDVIRQVKDHLEQKINAQAYANILSIITTIALRDNGMPRFFVEGELLLTFPIAVSKVTRQQHDILALCPFDYSRHELQLVTETDPILGCMIIALSAGWWSPSLDTCLISERPQYIYQDSNRLFHCEDGLAIGYPDGWGVYMWHGVRVPEYVIMRPHEITPDKIMNEQNAEVARAMLERYGQDNFIRNGGFTIQQSDDYGDLYRVEFANRDEPIVAVKVKDASTDREYFLYVPPHIQTAHEGVAWTFGYDNITDYNPDKET